MGELVESNCEQANRWNLQSGIGDKRVAPLLDLQSHVRRQQFAGAKVVSVVNLARDGRSISAKLDQDEIINKSIAAKGSRIIK